MQCSRCNIVVARQSDARRKPKRRVYRPTQTSNFVPNALVYGPIDAPSIDAENSDVPPAFERFGFFQLYSRSLGVCAITGLFSAAVIFFLSFSILHVGLAAIPFLAVFATGLLISIGLPFKMYKEYVTFSVVP